MANKLIYLLPLVFVLVDARFAPRTISDNTLELVHVLFRHGDRTPDKHVLYANDPHINYTYPPVGFGQLTNAGKKKEYALGKDLRKRYGKFLGNYNIDTIDARCTDYNRTKMSLQLVLASLFPPQDDLVWEKRLKWQPVPFNYWPIKDDHVIGDPYKNCPRYKKLYTDFLNSEEGLEMYENYTELAEYLTEVTGTNMTSKTLAELYFTLTIEHETGLKLPQWTDSLFPKTITDLTVADYCASTSTTNLKKLTSGFLMKKIISDTKAKIQRKSYDKTKMFLYSGHEYNLAFLLRFLGVFYPHVPPYGSYILIEIHNVGGIRGVKIFYQDYAYDKPRRLKLPKCEHFCRLEKFIELYRDYLPMAEEECFRNF